MASPPNAELRLSLGRGLRFSPVVSDGPGRTVVQESDRVGFELEAADGAELPDGRWRLRLGDELAEGGEASRYRGLAAWREELWFDSCRGPVVVGVEWNRGGDEDDLWETAVRATVHVVPSKIGEDAWQAMRADLVAVAADLASDLIGRATHGKRAGPGARGTIDELRAAGRAVPRLRAALAAISEQPHAVLSRRGAGAPVSPRPWDARAIAHLARAGRDPRRGGSQGRAARVPDTKPRPNLDVPEHRALAACLEDIARAMSICAGKARAEIASLQADRVWRDVSFEEGRRTLYEAQDAPRIQRLRAAEADADTIAEQARRLRRAPPLGSAGARGGGEATPVFANVPAYAAARRAVLRWRAEGGFAIDEGGDARRKASARMYEQWVFLQVAAALSRAGFVAEDAGDLLRRIGAARLVADLHRGASLRFRSASGGDVVSLAYEPWVRPKAAALAAGSAFYKGRSGDTAWSPDVLLAVHGRDPAAPPRAAFVLDAKYSRRLSERQWEETSKYLDIRRTADDARAVRQVWLVCPGVEGIGLRDDAVGWTPRGPDRPPDEFLQGYAGMAPDLAKAVGTPVPEAVDLVLGILTHAGLSLGTPDPEEP